MNEPIRLLQAEIRHDLQAIEQAYEELHRLSDKELDKQTGILIAYHLHVIYGLFENLLTRIATNFGNQIEDSSRWHALLLHRMTLDVPDVRPRVLSEETYQHLNELRRFRHLFRNAYVLHFDADRLRLLIRDAQRLEECYLPDIEAFLEFLNTLLE
jgi:hypothetical protein